VSLPSASLPIVIGALTAGGTGASENPRQAIAHAASGFDASQLQHLALQNAASMGEQNPGNMKAVQTTHAAAMSLMYPGSRPGAFNNFVADGTTVYVITMTGHFTAYDATVPPGIPLPTGTDETLVIDNQGDVLDLSLNDNPEPTLASVGPVIDIEGASASAADVRDGAVVGAITIGGGPPPRPGVKLAGTVTVFSKQGKVIARHKVRKGHDFRFVLAPGTYMINPGRQLHPKIGCAPRTVHVRATRTAHVNVETECGIA
jgi:hypothetical protein